MKRSARLLSLLYPFITLLYAALVMFSGVYDRKMQYISGGVIAAAAIITGAVVFIKKIDVTICFKAMTIGTIVTLFLWFVTIPSFEGSLQTGNSPSTLGIVSHIYYLAIYLGTVVIVALKQPDGIPDETKIAAFFSNPVLYVLFNRVVRIAAEFLKELKLI